MKEIPEIARGGKPIELTNPQPEVRKNAETAKDWVYTEEAVYLYRMAVLFKDRLFRSSTPFRQGQTTGTGDRFRKFTE
jgi:hypothetical protein